MKTLKRTIHADYQKLLRDPRWAEFSDEVKSRKGNVCEVCGDDDVKLEVHHLGYKEDHLPWEYEDYEVAVVCRDCHADFHKRADELWNEVLKTKNQWVIYECVKAVRRTMERHSAWTVKDPAIPDIGQDHMTKPLPIYTMLEVEQFYRDYLKNTPPS